MLSPRLSGSNPTVAAMSSSSTINTASSIPPSSSLNNLLNNAVASQPPKETVLIGKGVEAASNGNTAAHRRAVKKAETRALEFAATPVLLSLADRRLRTQTRTTNATILGTTFQTNLPKGLALYRELVEAVAKIGLNQTSYTSSASILAAAGVQDPHHQQQSTSNTSNNSNSVPNSRLNTPLPPPSASAINHNRTPTPPPTSNTQHHQQQSQSAAFPLPFGILPSDPPMVVQGKLLEVWAGFLGGEPRRVAREQANQNKLQQKSPSNWRNLNDCKMAGEAKAMLTLRKKKKSNFITSIKVHHVDLLLSRKVMTLTLATTLKL
jgi:hypothetical protein